MWDPKLEHLSRSEMAELQTTRLKKLVHYVYKQVPFYTQKFQEAGIHPDDIQHLDDLSRLPFTVKTDLRDHYPFGLFAVPMNEVIRTHASSGTTGKPTVVGYTRADIEMWSEVCARAFAMSGAKKGDVFQNAYGYGLFTGGLGMHYGSEYLGLNTIPVSGGNTARQMQLLQDFGTNVMACTPSYALTLADALQQAGIDPQSLPVRVFILGAEPWTEEMRNEIEARLHADAVNIYGLSEIIGPGVSNECVEAKDGMHIMEDHFLPEIINPETNEPMPAGGVGELTFTTLTKEALPLIRYRTGDLCSLNYDVCVCGRSLVRMSRILGRVDDMMVVRGVNVFPTQIESVLIAFDAISPHYQLIRSKKGQLEQLEVQVEVTESYAAGIGTAELDQDPNVQALIKEIKGRLKETLMIQVALKLILPGQAVRSQGGKIQRIIDKR